jgi:hypothetical protein
VLGKKGGNPAIVADGTFFGGICTFGQLKWCCSYLGYQAEKKGEHPEIGEILHSDDYLNFSLKMSGK